MNYKKWVRIPLGSLLCKYGKLQDISMLLARISRRKEMHRGAQKTISSAVFIGIIGTLIGIRIRRPSTVTIAEVYLVRSVDKSHGRMISKPAAPDLSPGAAAFGSFTPARVDSITGRRRGLLGLEIPQRWRGFCLFYLLAKPSSAAHLRRSPHGLNGRCCSSWSTASIV